MSPATVASSHPACARGFQYAGTAGKDGNDLLVGKISVIAGRTVTCDGYVERRGAGPQPGAG